MLSFTVTASAVNYFSFTNKDTGHGPVFAVTGSDPNVGLHINVQGTGTTIFGNGTVNSFTINNVASAVNSFNITNSIATVGPSLNVSGTDTNIAMNFNTQGTGAFNFFVDTLAAFQISGQASAVNYVQINNSITSNAPNISAVGTDPNIGIYLEGKGTGSVILANEGGLPILSASGVASAVNNIQIINSTMGNSPQINSTGTDTNIGMIFNTKGTGNFAFYANSVLSTLIEAQASAVNYFSLQSSPTGFGPTLYASGSDTNININLIPQGTGVVSVSGGLTMASGTVIILAKANGTEAANAVTASGNAGVITTSSLTTAGGSSYAITWTNTKISSTSVIHLSIMGGTNTTENITLKATAGGGTSTLTIYNNTAATALNGTILIGYTVF